MATETCGKLFNACFEENLNFIKIKELTAEQVAKVLSRDCLNSLCVYLGLPNENQKEVPTAQQLLREVWKFNDAMYDKLELWYEGEIEKI